MDARQQVTVQSIVADGGPFSVATTIGEFEARAIVNASGRWSNLNLQTAEETRREKWLGIKAHFAEPSPHRRWICISSTADTAEYNLLTSLEKTQILEE